MRRLPARHSVLRRAAESRRRLEVLETRSVMAITCALADGALTVCGTEPSDQIAVVAHNEGGAIHILGADNSLVASYSAADVQQIEVQAAGGADAVRYDAALASLINVTGTNAGVAAPAAPVRPLVSEESSHGHQHSASETAVTQTVAPEETKTAEPAADQSVQLLVSLPAATTVANYNAASVNSSSQSSSNLTVATDSGTSNIVHTHGSDGAQALSAAPTAGDSGHEGHSGADGVISTTATATATAISLTNPIASAAMSGGSSSGSRSSASEGAKSCELKTSFKGTSATLYTKYECKCDEKRWSSRRARAAASAANEESDSKNFGLRGPLNLVWDGGYDTCTDSDHALDEFARMQQEYADSAAAAVIPVELETPVAEEAGTDYFQVLGLSLLSVGAVGLAATRIPAARKRDEEEERALFLSLELLAR